MFGTFQFGLVDASGPADPSSETLGIEVTDPRLAASCGLGNIDPQHHDGALPDAPAAVEVALNWPLPPDGSRLVTLRPDLDALGAMAILGLRQQGVLLDAAICKRVGRVAAADRFDRGVWPGPRPLPTAIDNVFADESDSEIAAMAACAFDCSMPLAERVKTVAAWLVKGEVPPEHARSIRLRANRLFLSLSLGHTRVRAVPGSKIATVVSTEPGALGLGYRAAPVVIAMNPEFAFAGGNAGRKFTVARWSAADLDLVPVLASLRLQEPGWGGQAGIIGSPTAHPSELSLEIVVASVAAALDHASDTELSVAD